MKFTKSVVVVSILSKIQMSMLLLLIVFLSFSCSPVNIEAAKSLSATGRDTASQTQQNVLVSYKEYLRARDCEALQNGFMGTTDSNEYQEILKNYDEIQEELTKRSLVFERLADLYDAFGELAGLDAGGQTEKALGDLSGAINEYAKQIKQKPPISSDATAVISKIGGLVAREIQKAKIKEASIQTRTRVDALVQLLENPSVRKQLVRYRRFLFSNRKTAFEILWDEGVYDPKPIFDDFGEDAGLAVRKDVAERIKPDSKLGKALTEVLDKRLEMKSELIQRGYDDSIEALKQLVKEHEKLEQGAPLDLARLRTIAAELRSIAVLLSKAKTSVPISQ